MEFKMSFNMDNAAFDSHLVEDETARILKKVSSRVEHGACEGKITDINGNTIGNWEIEM